MAYTYDTCSEFIKDDLIRVLNRLGVSYSIKNMNTWFGWIFRIECTENQAKDIDKYIDFREQLRNTEIGEVSK